MNPRTPSLRFLLALCLVVLAVPSFAAAAPKPASAPSVPAADATHPAMPEDLWAMERVGSIAVSPDGRSAVFAVTAYSIDKNKGNSDLWLVPTDGGAKPRRLTWNEDTDGSPSWSPDGKTIAFVSKRGSDKDKPAQLYLLSLDGGEAQPATDLPVSPSAAKWSPDGARLFFAASTFPDLNDDWDKVKKRLDEQKDDKTKAKIADGLWLRAWDTYVTDGSISHLFAFDLATKKVRDLMPGFDRRAQFQGGGIDWDLAKDGREITFAANATASPFQEVDANLYVLPLSATAEPAGPIRDLTADQPADETSPRYSPDGRYVYYSRTRRREVDPDFQHLARLDRSTGKSEELYSNWDVAPSLSGFGPGGELLLLVEERARINLYLAHPDGGEPVRLLARGGVIAGADCGAAGQVVFTRTTLRAPAEIFALPLTAGGSETALSSFNTERVAKLSPIETSDIDVAGAGGEKVHVMVIFPPGFEAGKTKAPLLQAIHGGPFGAFQDEFSYRWNARVFASHGFLVAMVNFHGSTGYGQAFAESIVGAHGDKPFSDVQAATDELIARGWVDPKRLFAAGGSYGGYLVDWILGHTDRYAALISHAGVYDLMAQFASDAIWGRSGNYGSTPWEDPERIVRWSPSYYAKNFKTPTLVLHGERDFRVPVSQGINLHQVLAAKGIPTRIVIFPDENHWILKPQAAMLWWKEFFGWLDRWDVAKKPAPAEAKKTKG
ncbi:MAG TPA: S9 family peptidase [Thermoanaerobaculia bacterium]|jgi:dipeptidyl aminopeptidase/acylaminoacyl peptidase|nr:S9 family peptidase [Thermoanaerobaculia bacterium]